MPIFWLLEDAVLARREIDHDLVVGVALDAEDLRLLGHPREAAAGARARLDETLRLNLSV